MVDAVKAVIVSAVILLAIFFGFCCHFVSRNRREEELASRNSGARNSRTIQQTIVGNTRQNNTGPVFVMGLQGRGLNSNAREPGSHSGGGQPENQADETSLSPDPIVDSGPPPYGCLATSDEAPPPSYEDALRASTEHLPATRYQHIV